MARLAITPTAGIMSEAIKRLTASFGVTPMSMLRNSLPLFQSLIGERNQETVASILDRFRGR